MGQCSSPELPRLALFDLDAVAAAAAAAVVTFMSVMSGFVRSVAIKATPVKVLPSPGQCATTAPLPPEPILAAVRDPIVLTNKNLKASNCKKGEKQRIEVDCSMTKQRKDINR